MTEKLWFVSNGVYPIAVFFEKGSADEELGRFRDDPDFDYYSCYSVRIDDLDDYPDEFDLALNQGLVS